MVVIRDTEEVGDSRLRAVLGRVSGTDLRFVLLVRRVLLAVHRMPLLGNIAETSTTVSSKRRCGRSITVVADGRAGAGLGSRNVAAATSASGEGCFGLPATSVMDEFVLQGLLARLLLASAGVA